MKINDVFTNANIFFVVITIIAFGIVLFTFVIIFSPKLRAKMMSRNVKSLKYMTDYSKKDIEDIVKNIGDISINSKHKILTENKNKIKEITNIGEEALRDSIKNTLNTVKKSFKDNNYCKYCGKTIDVDSKYFKFCGENQ